MTWMLSVRVLLRLSTNPCKVKQHSQKCRCEGEKNDTKDREKMEQEVGAAGGGGAHLRSQHSREENARGSQVQDHPGIWRESEARVGYIVRPSVKIKSPLSCLKLRVMMPKGS